MTDQSRIGTLLEKAHNLGEPKSLSVTHKVKSNGGSELLEELETVSYKGTDFIPDGLTELEDMPTVKQMDVALKFMDTIGNHKNEVYCQATLQGKVLMVAKRAAHLPARLDAGMMKTLSKVDFRWFDTTGDGKLYNFGV